MPNWLILPSFPYFVTSDNSKIRKACQGSQTQTCQPVPHDSKQLEFLVHFSTVYSYIQTILLLHILSIQITMPLHSKSGGVWPPHDQTPFLSLMALDFQSESLDYYASIYWWNRQPSKIWSFSLPQLQISSVK